MKKIAGYFLLLIALTSLSFNSFSQSKELVPGYYVVVSAYASSCENLAKQYVEDLKQSGIAAEYGFDSGRKLYFVYLKDFTSLKES